MLGWIDTAEESYAYLVKREGAVKWASLVTAEDYSMATHNFVRLVSASGGMTDAQTEYARQIYQERIEPLAAELEGLPVATLDLLGRALGTAGEYDEATKVYRHGVRSWPSAFALHVGLALQLREVSPKREEEATTHTITDTEIPLHRWVHLRAEFDGFEALVYIDGVVAGRSRITEQKRRITRSEGDLFKIVMKIAVEQ